MRRTMPAILLASLAMPGITQAGSIDVLKAEASGYAVTELGCSGCASSASNQPTYIVPELKPGESRVEIKTIGNRHVMISTQSMMGGSPVRYIFTLSDEAYASMQNPADDKKLAAEPGIDKDARTAAVDPSTKTDAAAPVTAPEASEAKLADPKQPEPVTQPVAVTETAAPIAPAPQPEASQTAAAAPQPIAQPGDPLKLDSFEIRTN